MSKKTYIHPAAAGLSQVYPSRLSKPIRDVIATMSGRPNQTYPENYRQPHGNHCDSNCLLILWELSKINVDARAAYGVALLPSSWDVPSPARWRVHVWLLVGETRYDPTYEIAWNRDISEATYFEYSHLAYSELPAQERKAIESNWRQNGPFDDVQRKLRALGIDACSDVDL